MIRWWLVLGCVLAAHAAGASENSHLERAISLFEEMEYAAAEEAASRALGSPDAEPGDLVQAYRIQGLCLSALGRNEAALEAFRRLLAIDSSFRLSADISPKLSAPFYRAVAMTRGQKPILLLHERPSPVDKLGGLVLRVSLKSNPFAMVSKVRMRFVTPGEKTEKQMTAEVKGPATLGMRLPRDLQARAVRYYFEAVNRHGGVLARQGSRDAPLELRIRLAPPPVTVAPPPGSRTAQKSEVALEQRDDSTPWYKSWWFWTTVSVVIVGSTTGAILAAESGGSSGPVDYGIRVE